MPIWELPGGYGLPGGSPTACDPSAYQCLPVLPGPARQRLLTTRGVSSLAVLVIVIGTILRFAVWIALGIGIVLLAVALFTGWLDRRVDAREVRRRAAADKPAAIARRTDVQNAQVLAGDPRGIYGDYGPGAFPG